MKTTLILLALTFVSACSDNQSCPITGKWKSNEKLTLASMNETGRITEKQREIFENGFFGKLELDINCSSFTTTFDGVSETYSYETIHQTQDSVTASYYSKVLQKQVEVTSTITGNCYSTPIEQLNFNEYFCRIE
jgi:hypothetical protein